MTYIYKCDHFRIHELVPPTVYKERGQKAWELLDERILRAIDELRDTFGPITINNWYWGGKFKWSGLRTANCKIGAKYSQHRYGRAMDLKFKHATPKFIRASIRKDFPHWIDMGIHCVENKTKTWVHVSCQNCSAIKWINP